MSRTTGGGPGRDAAASDSGDRLSALFREALDLPPGKRRDYLQRETHGDVALRDQVLDLLAAHEDVEAEGDRLAALGSGLEQGHAGSLLRWAESLAAVDSAAVNAATDDDGALTGGRPPTPAFGPRPGDLVGRYRVLRVLGQGGMGTVYLAHDPVLERSVALKLLPPLPDGGRRLLEEARAASALDHPGIGTVHEVAEDARGQRVLVMASYEGGTLRDRLRGGPLPVREAVRIAVEVAEALDAAHHSGILHRDVKPENLLFDRAGRVKVVDFGIALGMDAEGRGPSSGGTAAYMSPEQVAGSPVDRRSDLWSAGVVLHEMLAGRRPFEGPDREALHRAILEGRSPDLRTLRPEVGAELARVVARAMDPAPDARFQRGQALADALRQASAASAVPAAPAAPPEAGTRTAAGDRGMRRRRMAAVAVGVGLVVLGVGVVSARQAPRLLEATGFAGDAFAPRGEVLVADFSTPDVLGPLALATREALVVDLQQSGFVRVVPRSRVEAALERMGVPGDTPVQGSVAREVAERVGAGAVVETTVARAGTRYVLAGRALDPASGEELFAVRTAGGERRLLGAVERLSREMRRRLGEAAESLGESRPLPEVTTASLEALRLYAEADRIFQQDPPRASAHLAAALELDPEFAMAHRLAAAAGVNQLRFADARHHVELAWEHRDRLADRERWHVEALRASEVDFDPPRAEVLQVRILDRFPDDYRAAINLANVRLSWLADPEGALMAALRAMELGPEEFGPVNMAAQAALILDRPEQADALVDRARAQWPEAILARWAVSRAFWAEDRAAVIQACDALLALNLPTAPGGDDRELCGTMDIGDGDLVRGRARLEAVYQDYLRDGRQRSAASVAQGLMVADLLEGDTARARSRIPAFLADFPPETFAEPDRHVTRSNLRIHASLLGWEDIARQVEAHYPSFGNRDHLLVQGAEQLIEAALAVYQGDGNRALQALEGAFPAGVMAVGWRTYDELFRAWAFELLGEDDLAAIHYRRAANRGWAALTAMSKDRLNLPMVREGLARVAPEAG
jgi:hypothetical protein